MEICHKNIGNRILIDNRYRCVLEKETKEATKINFNLNNLSNLDEK